MVLSNNLNECDHNKSSPKWVVVQLSSVGEREKNTDLIRNAVKRILGNVNVFIPAISEKVRDESHTSFFMEGYIFIEYNELINYMQLHDTTYFKSVMYNNYLRKNGPIKYQLVNDSDLVPVRVGLKEMKLRAIDVGDSVKVNKGKYKNLVGVVKQVLQDGETILIDTGLNSKPLMIEFPSSYLDKI